MTSPTKIRRIYVQALASLWAGPCSPGCDPVAWLLNVCALMTAALPSEEWGSAAFWLHEPGSQCSLCELTVLICKTEEGGSDRHTCFTGLSEDYMGSHTENTLRRGLAHGKRFINVSSPPPHPLVALSCIRIIHPMCCQR